MSVLQTVSWLELVSIGQAGIQVMQDSIIDAVYPAMYGEGLAAAPGILNDIRLAYTDDLLDNIKFAQFVNAQRFSLQRIDRGLVF